MADSISRQAAIDLVTDMEFMNNTAKGILRDRLRKLPSAQQWTPCSERLPEENGDYLVTIKLNIYVSNICSVIGYANDLYEVDEYDFHDKKGVSGWFFYDSEYGFGEETNVIAWMPLPEPYKEEQHG